MCVPPIALLICALWHIGSVNGYIGPRQDPSSVASAQSATATPTFSFNKISELTTCKPAGITWMYSPITVDDALELTLFITNDGVEQPPPVATTTGTFNTSSAARAVSQRDIAQPITQQITANPVDPLVRVFTWHSVNVSAGWYELIATLDLPNFSNISNTFFVKNGPNVSCITPTPTSVSSCTPTDHTSSHSATSIASVSPSTGVPAVTPGPSKHKVNRGVIVGGVVGGVASLCAAITAYLCLMRLRQRRNIPLLHTPVPPVLLTPSSPPPMRSKGATAVVVTQEVQPPAVAANTTPERQRRRDLEIEERLRHVEEQLASVSQPPAYN
ncbi:hypothetical protein B0H14DRAFT_3732485 [Mycena olivaceomarginata]|nr:hypothetical protein B0H14DRAFT_3732485 [Mycena olivaceomarginata]